MRRRVFFGLGGRLVGFSCLNVEGICGVGRGGVYDVFQYEVVFWCFVFLGGGERNWTMDGVVSKDILDMLKTCSFLQALFAGFFLTF